MKSLKILTSILLSALCFLSAPLKAITTEELQELAINNDRFENEALQFLERAFWRHETWHRFVAIIDMIENCDREDSLHVLSVQLAIELNTMKHRLKNQIEKSCSEKDYYRENIYNLSTAEEIKNYLHAIESCDESIKKFKCDIEFVEQLQEKYCHNLLGD